MKKQALVGMLLMITVLLGALVWHSNTFAPYAKDSPRKDMTIRTKPIDLEEHVHTVHADSVNDHGHHIGSFSDTIVATEDLWITAMTVGVTNAPEVAVHHVNLFQTNRSDPLCTNYIPHTILAFAQDQLHRPVAAFPDGYALFIASGTPMRLSSMFHNPEPPLGPGGQYKHVSVFVNFTLADEPTGLTPLEFRFLRLTENPCTLDTSGSVFEVPPHQERYTFAGIEGMDHPWKFTAPHRTEIVYWGAHLHGWEGGTQLRVRKNGSVIDRFDTKAAPWDVYRFDTPHRPTSHILEPGDTLSIEADYTNESDLISRGAMGMLGMYITVPDPSLLP